MNDANAAKPKGADDERRHSVDEPSTGDHEPYRSVCPICDQDGCHQCSYTGFVDGPLTYNVWWARRLLQARAGGVSVASFMSLHEAIARMAPVRSGRPCIVPPAPEDPAEVSFCRVADTWIDGLAGAPHDTMIDNLAGVA